MQSETQSITCPFCNTLLTEAVRRNDKECCPRCGEVLPETVTRVLHDQGGAALAGASGSDGSGAAPVRRSNRKVGLLILGGMLVVAGGALLFALSTQSQRRARDPSDPDPLYFLPRATNAALSIQVADILKDKDAAALLQDPRPGWLDTILNLVQAKTGLSLDALDRVVLGTTLADKIAPLTVIVRTRENYSLDLVAKAMQATPTERLGRPLYRFSVRPLGEAYLWCLGKKTIVLVWRAEAVAPGDLEAIPIEQKTEGVPPALRDYLASAEKQSLLWFAADLESLGRLEPLLALAKGPRLPPAWRGAKFAGLAVINEARPDEEARALTLRGQFQTEDGKQAALLEAALKEVSVPEQLSSKVIGPPPGATDPKELWVLWQVRIEVQGLKKWLTLKPAS